MSKFILVESTSRGERSNVALFIYFADLSFSTNYFTTFSLSLFFFFWVCWVFVTAYRLSLVVTSGATLHCGGRTFLAAKHGF